MSRCTYCGAENLPGARACVRCGRDPFLDPRSHPRPAIPSLPPPPPRGGCLPGALILCALMGVPVLAGVAMFFHQREALLALLSGAVLTMVITWRNPAPAYATIRGFFIAAGFTGFMAVSVGLLALAIYWSWLILQGAFSAVFG